MKAIVWTKYGPPEVLEPAEVEKPIPRDNQVLIRIHATTVTAGDCEMRNLKLPILFRLPMRLYVGLRKPKRLTILGQELAGQIEAAGKDVNSFKKGDEVFAAAGFHFGTYAEYVCLASTDVIAAKPANMTYEESAAMPVAGLEAMHFLGQAHIQSGENVLIYGAGGSIGTVAVQLAKSFGARVTAVDSTAKLDMLRSIGADHVIDYTRQDFSKSGLTYDVIFDIVGKSSFSGSKRSLKPDGRYLLGNAGLSQMVQAFWTSMTSRKKVILGAGVQKQENLIILKELIEAGKIKAVIDRRYPLEQIAEAHRYVETGNKKGNVVITVI